MDTSQSISQPALESPQPYFVTTVWSQVYKRYKPERQQLPCQARATFARFDDVERDDVERDDVERDDVERDDV